MGPKICPFGKNLSSWTCLEMLDELTRWTSVHVQPSLNLCPTGHLQGNDSRWSPGQGKSCPNLHSVMSEVMSKTVRTCVWDNPKMQPRTKSNGKGKWGKSWRFRRWFLVGNDRMCMWNSKPKDQAKRMMQDMQKVGALYKLCDQATDTSQTYL
jgi:hypothetical protein